MARDDKAAAVAQIADEFRGSNAAVLTEYRGLTVGQLKELRRSLGANATYAVVKNTLTRIAAKEAGVDGLDSLLVGPSAIAFVKGDPVEAAKGLRDFAKTYPLLVIKGGYMDGIVLSVAEINKLADLESREVLLAKLAGAMKASLSQAASLFIAPLSQAARTIEALRVKAEADPSVIAGAGIPAAPAADEAAPGVESAPEAEPASAASPEESATDEVAADVADVAADTQETSDVADEAPTEGTPEG
jgi:large subunit ribosomal protein L10